MVKHNFWDGLTRRIDAEGLEAICMDEKTADSDPRIYISYAEDAMFKYYKEVAETKPHLKLQVERLPKEITPDYVKSINDRPSILALAMEKTFDEKTEKYVGRGVPFAVPGGRFNEMYNWNSYFIALGLLVDGRVKLAQSMVDSFVYQIKHYGKY